MFDAIANNGAFQWFESTITLLSKGGIIMVPIFLCSIIALAIIIDRLYYFYKSYEDPEATFEALNNFLQDEEHPATVEFSRKSKGPVGRLLEGGLDHKDIPKWKLEEKLSLIGREELNKLGRHIRGLEVIATISPLMGLLGTVLGMVKAFSKVAQLKGQVDPSVLAGGIWEALMTTAAGLTVAIPAVVMLHYFDRRIEKVAFLLEKCGQLLIHHFDEEHGQKNDGNFVEREKKVVQPLVKIR